MSCNTIKLSVFLISASLCLFAGDSVFAQTNSDSSRFPLQDRIGDRFTYPNKNSFDLSDTSIIHQQIQYDPVTNRYYIFEKVGNNNFRQPTYLTFDEYYKLRAKQEEDNYFKLRAAALDSLNRKTTRPKPQVYNTLFDRIFGVNNVVSKTLNDTSNALHKYTNVPDLLKVKVQTQGNVELQTGYSGQKTLNPTLPENSRSVGGFDFKMNTNLNVIANIGDKLKLPFNYNTLANFDFLNKIKLNYKGMDDEIIRSIEAGNISFQSRGTLMPSAQNLFGIKTQLQFGRLSITAAIANSSSQMQSQTSQGGASTVTFNKKLDDYEENRNFLLAQYFKNNYNKAMSNLPIVNSQVQIQRMEVWVTNRSGYTTDTRYIVGLSDLGEANPYNSNVSSLTSNPLPSNGANNLYSFVVNATRDPSQVSTVLQNKGLNAVNDYEKVYARKLSSSEYYFNPQLGTLMLLNTQLQSDDVLAVAYQYTYNGRVYQVGEFSQDVSVDSTEGIQKILYLKLLKATAANVNLPIWQLMMKNVYSIGVNSVVKDGFQLNILYQQPGGGTNPYLPEAASAVNGKTLLKILNLDRLNSNNDPQPDGVYDFIDSLTILSQYGKIMFPVLEPFGKDLDSLAFSGVSSSIKQKYLFPQLYDSIKAIAQTYANLDRFYAKGSAKGTSTGNITLNAMNVPYGSVKVTANGTTLQEGVDYMVDYSTGGTVKIINQALINSNAAIKISYENNSTYGIQQRGFMGLRFDYNYSKKLSFGGGVVRLNERPFFTKMNYGEDPMRNTIYGLDFTYKSEWAGLTRALNKLPFYSTKAKSYVTAQGEGAYFKPGHPPQIGKGNSGAIYVDDFEGTTSNIDLRYPAISWALAATPQGATEFPEATLNDDLNYGKNRAKLAWYNIEPNLQDKTASNNPLSGNLNELSDPRVRMVYTNELYPEETTGITNTQTVTFDMAYYPTEKGPYNYESNPSQIDANGKLVNPQNRWAGITRSLDQTDFETNNIVYIEFLLQDPFIKDPNSTGGKLRIDLGDMSEDVLRDGKHSYENGLNAPNFSAAQDSSIWGDVPLNPIQTTNAFSNNAEDRPFQDVGLDGLSDDSERVKRNDYLTQLANNFGAGSVTYQKAVKDPSGDDYTWYRDASYNTAGTGILGRYKNYNGTEGNSPVVSGNSTLIAASTLYPDNEDLNHDNTVNETEQYFEYEVNLKPGMNSSNNSFISQVQPVSATYANGTKATENWYLFRIPISGYTSKVGSISDFQSIRFIRAYLTGFTDSVVLRFASFNLVRDMWRQFQYVLDTTGSYTPLTSTTTNFNVTSVSIEQNSSRTPVNYLIPPDIERVQQLSNNGVNLLQNEQSLSLQVHNLADGDARAVIKTFGDYDFRNYGKLSMFAHAEAVTGTILNDNDLNLVVRIGQDFLSNYYEIKIPLKVTPPGDYSSSQDTIVWPTANNLDFNLSVLTNLKLARNNAGASKTNIYRQYTNGRSYAIMGNPNIGDVTGILIGIENAQGGNVSPIDAEVWVDELRLSNINEQGAYAATGKVDFTLADLGKASVSVNTHTQGFGSIDSRINDRLRDNMVQFNGALSLDAGKLVPKKTRLSIPVYASYDQMVSLPEYDPYDLDISLKYKLDNAATKAIRDSIRRAAMDKTTFSSISFTNVRVMPKGKIHFWSISNFDVSYSYSKSKEVSPEIANNTVTKWRANVGYTYSHQAKFYQPFKKTIKSNSKWFSLAKDFNYSLAPSLLSFRADVNRQFGQYTPRIINTDLTTEQITSVDTTFDKYFKFDRYYNMRWNLTHSVNFDFAAINNAYVDEPDGFLNTKAKRDSVWRNFIKGGRNVMYQQNANLSYELPLNKFPVTDFIRTNYTYTTSYDWVAASRLAISLGNIIENSQGNNIVTDFDFTRLYNKWKWLRTAQSNNQTKKPAQPVYRNDKNFTAMNGGVSIRQSTVENSMPKTRSEVIHDKNGNKLHGKEKRDALRKWRQQKREARLAEKLNRAQTPSHEKSGLEKAAISLITMVKNINVEYNETYHSRIPGWMDSTQFLGQNWRSMEPGLSYVFGKQPDTGWLDRKAAKGLITRDSTFNLLYRQNFEQRFKFGAQIEPVRDLRITLNVEKSFSKEYTELFKDSTNSGLAQQHLSPYASGSFSVSYISFATLFEKRNPNEISATFQKFEDNRVIISRRMGAKNPYSLVPTTGYATGYGYTSQNVLIPAFLAAYTKKSPYTIGLMEETNGNIKQNPFKSILPKPNWQLTYTGLVKIPALASIFNSFSLSHGYSSTLSMNAFSSALNYSDPLHLGVPGFIDSTSGNFIPFFLVPNLTIQEQFTPLLGISFTTKNNLGLDLRYNRSRILSLSLTDYQLSETNSTGWTIGASWRKKGLQLPFNLPFTTGRKLINDVTFRLDFSLRDDLTTNSTIDAQNSYATGGQKVVRINPSINYVLNNRISLLLYFDQIRTTPYISTSSPTIRTQGGVKVTISLSNNYSVK